MNIYVGNLPYNLTEEELQQAFAQFGEVTRASIIMDKFSGQSKGFGFVEMPSDAAAQEAIRALHQSTLNGRAIKVNEAKPREDKPRGDRPRGPRQFRH
ncbi:MAG TPA: RNA-binding protein [Spongiibacteraceae bacterium]|jgi:RNA recognition motif-containing protein|nr:RNA-binding protein [Spongiibacteraceae bacterium]HUH37473.1 RNA-binding protein [Spongiibacteraceae bacterium]